MVLSPGFRSSPVTLRLIILTLATSLLVSLTTTKPLFHLQFHPHLLSEHQLSRLLLFQLPYTNSGELLFATLLAYHLRIVERIFGSRKLLSLVLYAWAVSSIIIPALLAVGWYVSRGRWNYVPPGPTAVLFAVLAQFHDVVPCTYRFVVVMPAGAGDWAVGEKAWTYVIAAQLAGQGVGSVVAAAVGWVVGVAWREEWVSGGRWRVGRWVVELLGGEKEGVEEYAGLRRRLRGETGQGEEAGGTWMGRMAGVFRG